METFTPFSLSQELGLDRHAIQRRLRGLDPVETKTRANGAVVKRYALLDVVRHLMKSGSSGEDPEQMSPRERLDYYKGCRERDLHKQQSGELVHVDEVSEAWGKIVATARARLLALPMRLAPELVGISDLRKAEDVIKAAVFEALDDLSKTDPSEIA